MDNRAVQIGKQPRLQTEKPSALHTILEKLASFENGYTLCWNLDYLTCFGI